MNAHALNASDVRKDWGRFIDDTVRRRPQFVKRSRDQIVTMGTDMFCELLKAYPMSACSFEEADGSVTVSLDQLDLAVNAATETDAVMLLAHDMVEYAEEFYESFEIWSAAPNRKNHIPYVLKILSSRDASEVRGLIECRHGKK